MTDVLDNSATRAAGDILGKKYGPLPFGAWLLVAGGTAFFVRRYLSRNDRAADDATGDATEGTATDSGGVYESDGTYSYPGADYSGRVGSSAPYEPVNGNGGDVEDAQAAWQEQAVRALVGKGIGAYDAQNAIGLYLRSQPLTAAQKAYVSEALALVGTPPNGIPVAPSDEPTTPVPTPVPTYRNIKSTIVITPRTIPKSKGQDLVYDVLWTEDGSRKGITGTLTVYTLNGSVWTVSRSVKITNGTVAGARIKYGVGGKRGVRLQVSNTDAVHAKAVSNSLVFNVK